MKWKEVKQSLFIDDILVYVEIPNESTATLKKPVSNEFISKIIGYKVNILKITTFLYTSNEQL